VFVLKILIKSSVNNHSDCVVIKFWLIRLNLWDEKNNSLNILIIKNWKKLKIKSNDNNSIIKLLFTKYNIKKYNNAV